MGSNTTDIQEHVPLAPLTTFAVGGPARYFIQVESQQDAVTALAFACDQGLDLLVLGGGSNLLVSDNGFPGLVILNRIKGMAVEEAGDAVLVTVGGGEEWQDFVDLCVARNWQGVECMAGIPGTVGASPIQNIGAYGQEVSQVIERVHCLDTRTGNEVTFENDECAFRYRESIFNTREAGNYLVISVRFKLCRDGASVVTYRELEARLAGIPSPTLAQVRDEVLAIRSGKGVLVRSGYESFKSAGSFFKNPIVPHEQFEHLAAIVGESGGSGTWAWPLPDGRVKLSAAYLIQSAGFTRGYRMGNVGISPYHTLILINCGEASARDIVGFAETVRLRVLDLFGVMLQPEARLVGFGSKT